ncbi:MAG: hypothetical protein MZV65_31210 [Chromatiales bacterium]|nr:hypothetical protein [Chromatiales bacterium]
MAASAGVMVNGMVVGLLGNPDRVASRRTRTPAATLRVPAVQQAAHRAGEGEDAQLDELAAAHEAGDKGSENHRHEDETDRERRGGGDLAARSPGR